MRYFEVALTCGCCSATLAFESEERLQEAFKPLGLTVDGVVTDDEGVVHEDIDTFYGFRDLADVPEADPAPTGRKARKQARKARRVAVMASKRKR